MREHILVCPFDEKLLGQMHDENLVVIAPSVEQIPDVYRISSDRKNRVRCVVVSTKGSLASVPFHESWKGIPIAIYAEELGPFKEFLSKMQLIRDLNIRFYLSSGHKENFTALHVLASLHLNCGVAFDEQEIDWEALNDLMTYSVYGKVQHGPIEPFKYITTQYHPEKYTEFNTVYFDNPHIYLHLDKDANIAVSRKDLQKGNFIASGYNELDKIKANPKYEEALNHWQSFFLKENGCAFCQSWRVCMGTFVDKVESNPGCQKFFADMMDAADHSLSNQQKNREREIWQP